MIRWLRQFWCGLRKHHGMMLVVRTENRIYFHCWVCGLDTPGWNLERRREGA